MRRTQNAGLILTVLIAPFAMAQTARAGFSLGQAANYAVLYEGNGGNTLSINNGPMTNGLAVTGNIGVGLTGKVHLSGPLTIDGNIDFSAGDTNQCQNCVNGSGGNIYLPEAVNYSDANVTTALTTVNTLSETLGEEAGTTVNIVSGGSLNATSGNLINGNYVFSATNVNCANGTFTINGTASQYVVINITGNNPNLNGSIVLSGGITSDHVLFNITPEWSSTNASIQAAYENDYTTLTGAPTLTINTNGLTTTGTFLDPDGNFQVNHSIIDGRIFGGDTQNVSIVSGGYVDAPMSGTPEPGYYALTGLGLAIAFVYRKKSLRSQHNPAR